MASWTMIADLPSTNFRVFVSVLLEILFFVVVLVAIALGRPLQAEIVYALGFFLTVWLGIDVAQFKIKRDSFVAALPMAPETDGTPPSAPVVAPTTFASARAGRDMGEA